MRWAPKKFNDTFGLVVMSWVMALMTYVVVAGIKIEAVGMVIGAIIGWGGTILSFYFRKAPTDTTTPPSVP